MLANEPRLPPVTRQAVEDRDNLIMVSTASVWEIETKRALGKLEAPDDLPEALAAGGYRPLPIHLIHAVTAGRLPRLHRDPFDRMLIAQAMLEHLTVVTDDRRFADYGVPILWD